MLRMPTIPNTHKTSAMIRNTTLHCLSLFSLRDIDYSSYQSFKLPNVYIVKMTKNIFIPPSSFDFTSDSLEFTVIFTPFNSTIYTSFAFRNSRLQIRLLRKTKKVVEKMIITRDKATKEDRYYFEILLPSLQLSRSSIHCPWNNNRVQLAPKESKWRSSSTNQYGLQSSAFCPQPASYSY